MFSKAFQKTYIEKEVKNLGSLCWEKQVKLGDNTGKCVGSRWALGFCKVFIWLTIGIAHVNFDIIL